LGSIGVAGVDGVAGNARHRQTGQRDELGRLPERVEDPPTRDRPVQPDAVRGEHKVVHRVDVADGVESRRVVQTRGRSLVLLTSRTPVGDGELDLAVVVRDATGLDGLHDQPLDPVVELATTQCVVDEQDGAGSRRPCAR
jgi:hypothetical protein